MEKIFSFRGNFEGFQRGQMEFSGEFITVEVRLNVSLEGRKMLSERLENAVLKAEKSCLEGLKWLLKRRIG